MKFREVADGPQTAVWRIHLFGEFRLISPDGAAHCLRNRKCEGLIAILAANPSGVPRELAAESLWPEKPVEKRQESLRQAIAIVRRELGDDVIDSSRTECRLSKLYRFESDLENKELRDDPLFMPGQEGDWFERMRVQEESITTESEEPSVMSHYLQSLRWCARADPRSLFAFFNVNRSLVRGLRTGEILSLLELAGSPSGFSGWPDYWRGVCEEDLEVSASSLRRALRVAIHEQDWDLASDSCFELGKTYSRRGEIVRANRIAQAAEEVADRAKTKSTRINAARLKGTLLVHWGHSKAGLELLDMSANLVDDPVRRAIVESTQAWFEAVSGLYVSAARRLEIGEALARETGHHQAGLLTSLTRTLLLIHEGARTSAIPDLERVAQRCYEAGSSQFGVYAEESLAKLHLLDRDRELAAAKLSSARLNRIRTRMAKTPIERSMIAAIR